MTRVPVTGDSGVLGRRAEGAQWPNERSSWKPNASKRRQADRERLEEAAGALLSSDGWQRWVRVRAQQQMREHGALLGPAQRDGPIVPHRLERPEHPELHRATVPAGSRIFQATPGTFR